MNISVTDSLRVTEPLGLLKISRQYRNSQLLGSQHTTSSIAWINSSALDFVLPYSRVAHHPTRTGLEPVKGYTIARHSSLVPREGATKTNRSLCDIFHRSMELVFYHQLLFGRLTILGRVLTSELPLAILSLGLLNNHVVVILLNDHLVLLGLG